MVYLCWERCHENGLAPSTLIGVYPDADGARVQCEDRAAQLSKGSGLISETITGDSWDVTDNKRRRFSVGFHSHPFGVVDSF